MKTHDDSFYVDNDDHNYKLHNTNNKVYYFDFVTPFPAFSKSQNHFTFKIGVDGTSNFMCVNNSMVYPCPNGVIFNTYSQEQVSGRYLSTGNQLNGNTFNNGDFIKLGTFEAILYARIYTIENFKYISDYEC